MSICIFGGTGFIGRHLCQQLHAANIGATVVSRNPDRKFLADHAPALVSLTIDDPAVEDALKEASVVFYLASGTRPASSPLDPAFELAQAAEGAALMTAIRDINPDCHIVFASSGGQIYGQGHDRPIAETAPAQPATAYALGKLMMEDILSFHQRATGLGVTILRVANPVGRWQFGKGHGLVAAAIQSARTEKPLTIFGDGANMRDYFDADELATLLGRFADPAFRPQGVYNIGSGVGVTEAGVIEIVQRVTRRTIPLIFAPARPFDLRYAVLDVGRARRELGWAPRHDLESTVAKILENLGA